MKIEPCNHCLFQGGCLREDAYYRLKLRWEAEAREENRMHKKYAHRVQNKKLIAPLILTAMGVTCTKYYEQFEPGDRVEFYYQSCEEGGEYGRMDWSEDVVQGTVMAWKKRQVVVWLDEKIWLSETGDAKQIILIHPKNHRSGAQRIVKTGLKIKVCPECGIPEGQENAEGWGCVTCEKLKEEK